MMFKETEQVIATGTGFIYEFEDKYYLITNGHNITGVNPETNTRVVDHSGIPDLIVTKCRIDYGKGIAGLKAFSIKLYEDDFQEFPLWYIHPAYGYKVDVVALPIIEKSNLKAHTKLFPINNF